MARGLLIAFEGPDFAGKTLHSECQFSRLMALLPPLPGDTPPVLLLHFPAKLDPAIGDILLRHNCPAYSVSAPRVLNRRSQYLRQSALIHDEFSQISKALYSGQHVIVDSYLFSEIASVDFEAEHHDDLSVELCLALSTSKAFVPGKSLFYNFFVFIVVDTIVYFYFLDIIISLVAPLSELAFRAGFSSRMDEPDWYCIVVNEAFACNQLFFLISGINFELLKNACLLIYVISKSRPLSRTGRGLVYPPPKLKPEIPPFPFRP